MQCHCFEKHVRCEGKKELSGCGNNLTPTVNPFLEPLDSFCATCRQSGHFTFHVDQCINIAMANRREFDLFTFIFNSDGEEDEPTAEPQYSPLVYLTVDSDEEGASNWAAVMQQNQPQSSSRLPRRAQPSKLQEPATDLEEEDDDDDDESDEDASSSSRKQAVDE